MSKDPKTRLIQRTSRSHAKAPDANDIRRRSGTDGLRTVFDKNIRPITSKHITDGGRAESQTTTTNTANDTDEVISKLVAATPLQYAKQRKDAAKKIGIPVGRLDKIVDLQRQNERAPESPLYPHWAVEPCNDPVDGKLLLQRLKQKILCHVVMSLDQALVVALWVMLTWVHETAAVHSPLLLVSSAEANSGKSTLIGVIGFLVRRLLLSVSISGAALFRSIEKWQPTIAIDEADTALVNNDDLKAVINSGWTRGQSVIRCDPETHEPHPYSTFAPKVICMKGRKLPDTTLSRAIIIEMKRKLPGEKAMDFDHIDDAEFTDLRRQLSRWANDNGKALCNAMPEIPSGFNNRLRMNWKLLLAIAERCGAELQARQSAVAIEQVRASFEPSKGQQLLQAIKNFFETRKVDRVTSATLVSELVADETAPWRPITRADRFRSGRLRGY